MQAIRSLARDHDSPSTVDIRYPVCDSAVTRRGTDAQKYTRWCDRYRTECVPDLRSPALLEHWRRHKGDAVMITSLDHPLVTALEEAAHGRFPEPDGAAVVGGPIPGPCDSVAFFADHIVVAADVSESWVQEQFDRYQSNRSPEDPATGLAVFLGAFSAKLGNPAISANLLTVSPYRADYLHGTLEPGGEADPGWAAYHTEVRCHRYVGAANSGVIAIGRGPGQRWDVHLRIDESDRSGGGAAQELLTAAKTIVPDRGLLFGSAPLHDPRLLRIGMSSGFRAVCTEVLFLTRPTA